MNRQNAQTPEAIPPRLIPALASGFNAVASHIHLILLPVALDLLLWFGPHLRLKSLLLPFVIDTIETVRDTGTPQARDMLIGIEDVWKIFLERYNLLSSVSTFPLGVPSLMAGQAPIQTPFGNAPIVEVTSPLLVPMFWLFLSVLGLILGSFYFSTVARFCQAEPASKQTSAFSMRVLVWQTVQLLLLVIFLFILLAVLFLPTLAISSVLVLLSPALAWIVMLGMSFITIWVVMPLIFSPHGIFAYQQNTLNAALNSARMVRFFLPGTGLFVLIAIVLYQGLGVLWRTPPDTSWMTFIGIAGHAFISTGLVASSFFYYLNGLKWVQAMRRPATVASA